MSQNDVWVLQVKETNQLLGVFSSRDSAITAGSVWLQTAENSSSFEIKAIPINQLI